MVVELLPSGKKKENVTSDQGVGTGVGEESLSFIKGDEFDKRLTLDFGGTVDSDPSESTGIGTEVGGIGEGGSAASSPTSKCLLVIDLRSFFQYQESHVRQSINLTNCPLVSKRIQDGKLQIKEYLEARVMFDGTQDVVIYEQGGCKYDCDCEDQEGSGVTDFAKLIFLNLSKVKCDEAKIEILRGGFDSFRKKYPKHCTQGLPFVSRFMFTNNVNDDEMAFLNWEASEIRKNIYVGALHDAQNDKLLDRLGITHILNCCKTNSRPVKECDDGSVAKYQYLQLMCDDNLQQTLDDKLDPAFKFIDAAVETEGKVLIHCYAGISRSAAITIAYMMHKLDMSYDQSYSELKLKRSIVAPNINFVSQLMKFDEEKKQVALQKQKEKSIQLAPAPIVLKLSKNNGASGLAAKRKMMLPLPMKLDGNIKPAPVAASAPLMSPSYNPFAAAFKKANSNQCTESIVTPFERKMEILLE